MLSVPCVSQQFFYFFKTLVGKPVVVELKNDISLRGRLHSVDQYLNIKLDDMHVMEPDKHPHLSAVNNCFIRGSVVRSALALLMLSLAAPRVLLSSPPLCFSTPALLRCGCVRYIQLPAADVDTQLLQDAARRAARGQQQQAAAT